MRLLGLVLLMVAVLIVIQERNAAARGIASVHGLGIRGA
jgi:hypothetical protein